MPMPVAVEPPRERLPESSAVPSAARDALVIGLVNNMPDPALEATEAQFLGLLQAAAGPQPLKVRLTSLPELARGTEALARISRDYWPLEDLLDQRVDALIVTGTEPREPRLREEPYWPRLVDLLAWAQQHTAASVWSCLAAHAAVLELDGVERRRLPEKRSGVYAHALLAGHPLLAGVEAPMYMPHSRWNELPASELRETGYTVLSWSAETGVDAFVRQRGSLLLFFQGHPEYQATTLLREYRRDVGRFLAAQRDRYPAEPVGCFTAEQRATLEAFREQAMTKRDVALLDRFPFAALAPGLQEPWRAAAVAIYRNWLSVVAAARHATEPASAIAVPRQ
jgi:homoserine O-succinyltransferase/O-acetyltransferase